MRSVIINTAPNRSILNVVWGLIALYLFYKAKNSNKICLKVDPRFSSQECASCGHTHPENRRSQSELCCRSCGHHENADLNAARVLQKRGLEVIFEKVTHGRWESARGKTPRKQSLRRAAVRSRVSENQESASARASPREAYPF
jgi:putative transposase